jgi:hypothetical protein
MRKKGKLKIMDFFKFNAYFMEILMMISILFFMQNLFAQDDPKVLANQANTELRDSQRLMFSGKFDEALNHLNNASALIEKIKAIDPGFSQLATLESKLKRQKSDLEKRMPKTETPKVSTPAPKPASSASTSDELPSAVTRRLSEIDKNFQNAEKIFNSPVSTTKQTQLDELNRHIGAAENNMEQLFKYYGDKIPADHPEIKIRKDKLAELQKRYQAEKSETETAAAQAAQAKGNQLQEAQKLATELNALNDQHSEKFEGIYGATLVYSVTDANEAKTQLAKVELIEKEVLPVLQPVLAKIAETYGKSAMDINNSLNKLGMERSEQFGNKFERLFEGVENVTKSRKATAQFMAQNCKDQISSIDFYTPDIRVQKIEETKKLLQVGHQFDPNNNEINDMLSTIDQKIDEVADKIETDIESKNWAGNINNFAGPGDTGALAKTALTFFKDHPNWGKNPKVQNLEILNVCVMGQWDVAETNIFGQVIQWRLPIHLAITNGQLKPKNIARVYELSILTTKGNPGQVKKAPPFDGYWVGNNWMMRLNKLP